MSFTNNGGLGGKRQNPEEISIDFREELEEDVVFWEKYAVIAKIIGLNWPRKEIKKWNWFAQDHAIYLQLWSPNFNPLLLAIYTAPVWIRLYNLPIEYWSENVLEKISRTLGTLLEVDFDDEEGLCKIARLRIDAVKRIHVSLTLLTANRDWRQQVENEKEIKQCPRCGRKFHGLEDCKMFVRKAKNVIRKPSKVWRRKSGIKTVTDQEGKKSGEDDQNRIHDHNPLTSLVLTPCLLKDTNEEEKVLVLGECDEGSSLNNNAVGEIDAPISPSFNPSCKGLSDTKFEFEKGLDDGFLHDELENIDPRCISQSANALLGKAKGAIDRKER
ncbi:hypothetical protein SUGI_0841860 [Cryptomeria japonica]|nr:hypothetical protein SUGI_0841860 [Cryptomeria japonica]